jgi:hypothetical protein
MNGPGSGGNGELTREILKAELRAGLAEQTNALRREMDERFKPVNEHIAKVERGELTPAQKAAIAEVVKDKDEHKVAMRAMKAPVIALAISVAALVATVALTIVSGFHFV